MTEQIQEGHEIPVYCLKGSRKSRDTQAGLLFKPCETSITPRLVENVFNIVLFLIPADWFLPIIAPKFAFLSIVV